MPAGTKQTGKALKSLAPMRAQKGGVAEDKQQEGEGAASGPPPPLIDPNQSFANVTNSPRTKGVEELMAEATAKRAEMEEKRKELAEIESQLHTSGETIEDVSTPTSGKSSRKSEKKRRNEKEREPKI